MRWLAWGEPMESQRENSDNVQRTLDLRARQSRRNSLPGLLFLFGAMFLLFGFFYFFSHVQFCAAEERIVTPEAAVAFGKDYLRQDKSVWKAFGITSSEKLESILNTGICCSASRLDSFWDNPPNWRVFIGGQINGKYNFSYEVFFSECKRNPHVQAMTY
jgi:hypothetical protein